MSTSTQAEMNELGYCGLIMPDKPAWQGMYILPDFAATAKEAAAQAKLVTKSKEEQIGALSATLAFAYEQGNKIVAGVTSYAIMELTGWKYFIVVARGGDARYGTTVTRIDADSTAGARDAVDAHPEVVKAKKTLLTEMLTKLSGEMGVDQSGFRVVEVKGDGSVADVVGDMVAKTHATTVDEVLAGTNDGVRVVNVWSDGTADVSTKGADKPDKHTKSVGAKCSVCLAQYDCPSVDFSTDPVDPIDLRDHTLH